MGPGPGDAAGGARGGAEGAAAALTARCSLVLDEDHNSCRNPNGDAAPWCYVQGATGVPERRSCDIAQCSGKSGRRRSPSFRALPGLPPTAGSWVWHQGGVPPAHKQPRATPASPSETPCTQGPPSAPARVCTSASRRCRAPPLENGFAISARKGL